MKVIPTLKILENNQDYRKVIENFIDTKSEYIRFVVTRDSIEAHESAISICQEIYKQITGTEFKIMLDVPFPKDKLRFKFDDSYEKIGVNEGEVICITNNLNYKDDKNKTFYVDGSFTKCFLNENLIIGDGDLNVTILNIAADMIICKCLNSATVKKGKAISGQNGFLKETDSDIYEKSLEIIKRIKPFSVVLSYVENENDVYSCIEKINKVAGYRPHIMSKIESNGGLINSDNIIKCSDSIMIARGCLAVNIGAENLLNGEDYIMQKCIRENKEVYIASNILKSLNVNNWPTRSDICDIAHMFRMGLENVVITDKICMSNKYKTLIYYANKTYKQCLKYDENKKWTDIIL